jgi:hypothetical protein
MNWTKSPFVCAAVVLASNVYLLAKEQAAEGGALSKQAAPAAQGAHEKSVQREPSGRSTESDSKDEFCQCIDQKESAAAKKIEQVLAGPLHSIGITVADQPLKDVLDQLQQEYAIPIQIDGAALDAAGVGIDAPVTRSLHNVSLRSTLKLMLEPLELTWTIRDEVLMVTTREAADRRLVVCVYNVQGLVNDSDPTSMDGLISAIHCCVAPQSWSGNADKRADIRPLKPGLLVVSQTPAIHEEVSELLAKIRKARGQVPATIARPHAASPTPVKPSPKDTRKDSKPEIKERDNRNDVSSNPFGG